MKVKVIKGKVSFNGERHNVGEVFDVDSVMGRHLIEHKLIEQVVSKEPPAPTIVEPVNGVKPEEMVDEESKSPKARKGKK